ncbi:PAS domain S-box protein [bacterium]|nr:PAS domain S-box protein [bacterium]
MASSAGKHRGESVSGKQDKSVDFSRKGFPASLLENPMFKNSFNNSPFPKLLTDCSDSFHILAINSVLNSLLKGVEISFENLTLPELIPLPDHWNLDQVVRTGSVFHSTIPNLKGRLATITVEFVSDADESMLLFTILLDDRKSLREPEGFADTHLVREFIASSQDAILYFRVKPEIQLSTISDSIIRELFNNVKMLTANEKAQDLYGFSENSTSDSNFRDTILHHHPNPERLIQSFLKKGGRLDHVELKAKNSTGTYYLLTSMIGEVKSEKLTGIWLIQQDITAHKRSVALMRATQSRLQSILDNASDAIISIDNDDTILLFNNRAEKIFGVEAKDVLGEHIRKILPEGDYNTPRENLRSRKVSNRENDERQILYGLRRNGEEFPVEANFSMHNFDNREIFTAVLRDISDIERSERLQTVLFRIAESSTDSTDLEDLLALIHEGLSSLIDTTNIFIALYNENSDTYTFPYYVDEEDTDFDTSVSHELKKSLTDYVRRIGKPLLANDELIQQLLKNGDIELIGSYSPSWMAVPLNTPNGTIGVMVVQSYQKSKLYKLHDLSVMNFVSGQIALSIERKRDQDALRASKERYETLFTQSPVGVIIYNRYLTIEDVNVRQATIMNATVSDVIGYDLHKLNDQRIVDTLSVVFKGESSTFEGSYFDSEKGFDLWLSIYVTPLFDSEGEIIGGMAVTDDLTYRREVEQQLRIQKAQLEELIESAPEAIVVLDNDGIVSRINQEFTRMFGHTAEEVTGKLINSLVVPPDQKEESIRLTKQASLGTRVNVETVRKHKDGSLIDVSILATPIMSEGKNIGVYGIYRDITNRKRHERLRSVMHKISEATSVSMDLGDLLRSIHRELSLLVDCRNSYVAIYDEDRREYYCPFIFDEKTDLESDRYYSLEGSFTDYVRRNGETLLVTQEIEEEFKSLGAASFLVTSPKSWLGCPLKTSNETIGVFVVQNYDDENAYSSLEREIIESISGNIALAIHRKQSEEALQISEERYRALFYESPVGVVLFDDKLHVQTYNERFAEILGIRDNDYFGFNIKALEFPLIRRKLQLTLRGSSHHFDGTFEREDGNKIWLSMRFTPLFDEFGNVKSGMGVIEDITERKQVEAALRESDERMRLLTDNIDAVLWSADIEAETFKFTYKVLTENIFKISGYQTKEYMVPGKSLWMDLIHPDDLSQFLDAENRMLEGESVSATYRIFRKDGKIRWLYDIMTPVVDDKGNVTVVNGLTFDQTERIESEKALAEEKERLAVTLRSIGDAVISTDTEGRISLMNPIAERMTGWKLEEANGKLLAQVFLLKDERTGQPVENPVDMVLKTSAVVDFTYHRILLTREGERIHIASSASPIRDRESNIIGVVLVFRDISEQREMEQELVKAQKLESLSVLAGGIAHDFNNILAAILGNISLTKLYVKDQEKPSARLEEAEKATIRAKDLTQQLLTFSKGGAPVRRTASIRDIIKDSTMFALTGSNVSHDIQIAKNLYPVDVDEGQISQVLHNMVLNADQAMPDGGVLKVYANNYKLTPSDALPLPPGDYVEITISDQGIGIPRDSVHRIFDPYFTTKTAGSGLGLASSFSIVSHHDGHIKVESEPGRGTDFIIYLPASKDEITQRDSTSPKLSFGSGKILIMDDEESVRDIATEILNYLGYKTVAVEHGEAALLEYRDAKENDEPFDLVILDLTVPGGMGGQETIAKLCEFDPEVTAIVSSGYSNAPIMAEYEKFGFADVVSKPYMVDDLSKVINRLLRNNNEESI